MEGNKNHLEQMYPDRWHNVDRSRRSPAGGCSDSAPLNRAGSEPRSAALMETFEPRVTDSDLTKEMSPFCQIRNCHLEGVSECDPQRIDLLTKFLAGDAQWFLQQEH